MANKEKKRTNTELDAQRQSSNDAYSTFLKGANEDLQTARGNSGALRQQIVERYSDPNMFMPKGMQPNASGWFNLPEEQGGGGSGFGEARAGYSRMAETGGVNRPDFDPALSSYRNFMSTGGVDATALRQRATAQIPSFYTGYKNALARRANVQGGYSPGFDSQMAEIGREAGRGGFEASRQVEGDIADKIQQGKMFGTTGFGGLMSNITGMEQQGKLAGLGGLTNIAGTQAGLAEARNARNQQAQLSLARMYQQGGQFGASGLSDLYRSAPGDVGQAQDAWLRAQGGMRNNELGNLGIRGQLAARGGIDWMRLLGMGSSLLGGFGGGGASTRDVGINDAYRNDGTVMA